MTLKLRVVGAMIILSALATVTDELNAQDSARVSRSPPPLERRAPPQTSTERVVVTRAALGTAGWFVGAGTGLLIASVLPHHDCHCDDPGLTELLVGLAVGSVVGTAAGAGAPSFGRKCSFGTRVGRAFLGAVGGTLLGGVISAANDNYFVVVVPVFAATGATLAVGHC